MSEIKKTEKKSNLQTAGLFFVFLNPYNCYEAKEAGHFILISIKFTIMVINLEVIGVS